MFEDFVPRAQMPKKDKLKRKNDTVLKYWRK